VGRQQTPVPEEGHEYTGKLYRGEHEGSVRGWLIDRMGTRIEFNGVKDPRPDKGGYILIGKVGHMPGHLHIHGEDH
jgi:hypothetical protein